MTSPTTLAATPATAERPSADIIPFPTRAKPAEPSPEVRLAKALDSLNAAMADQRAAVAAWRSVLGELKATTSGLDQSLNRYRGNLRALSTSVASLHARAKTLEEWADNAAAD
jgi:ABC-type transporter Mla subunit MlaD